MDTLKKVAAWTKTPLVLPRGWLLLAFAVLGIAIICAARTDAQITAAIISAVGTILAGGLAAGLLLWQGRKALAEYREKEQARATVAKHAEVVNELSALVNRACSAFFSPRAGVLLVLAGRKDVPTPAELNRESDKLFMAGMCYTNDNSLYMSDALLKDIGRFWEILGEIWRDASTLPTESSETLQYYETEKAVEVKDEVQQLLVLIRSEMRTILGIPDRLDPAA